MHGGPIPVPASVNSVTILGLFCTVYRDKTGSVTGPDCPRCCWDFWLLLLEHQMPLQPGGQMRRPVNTVATEKNTQ